MRSFSHKHEGQRGFMDLSLLFSVGVLFFVVSGAVVYFLIFGTPEINTPKIVANAISASVAIDSYTVKLQIQPSPQSFITGPFAGQVVYDVKGKKADGTFDVPSLGGSTKPVSRIEAFLSDTDSYARYVPGDNPPKDLPLYPKDWFTVDPKDKPVEYRVVEQAFALADFTKILREGSGYIMSQNDAVEETLNGTKTYHLTLRRQETFAPGLPQENLAFFAALSDANDINVWVDATTYNVIEMRFVINGFGIIADVSEINKAGNLSVPNPVIAYSDWKTKVFNASIPNLTPITQISIGSYGTIKPAYLEGIRQIIQKSTGVTTTVLNSAPLPEQKAPIFEPKLSSWNANALMTGVEEASASFGPNVRVLYVVADPMFPPFQSDKPFVWTNGTFGANAAVVSLSGLDKAADLATSTASDALVIARAQKVALYALGQTVGFDHSPSSVSNKCVMYSAANLADLDNEDASYCPQEKIFIPKIFKIK